MEGTISTSTSWWPNFRMSHLFLPLFLLVSFSLSLFRLFSVFAFASGINLSLSKRQRAPLSRKSGGRRRRITKSEKSGRKDGGFSLTRPLPSNYSSSFSSTSSSTSSPFSSSSFPLSSSPSSSSDLGRPHPASPDIKRRG